MKEEQLNLAMPHDYEVGIVSKDEIMDMVNEKTKNYKILSDIVQTMNESIQHEATVYQEDDKTILKVVINGVTVRATLTNIDDYDLSCDDSLEYVKERVEYILDNLFDILLDKPHDVNA